jgi:hypothetical protein
MVTVKSAAFLDVMHCSMINSHVSVETNLPGTIDSSETSVFLSGCAASRHVSTELLSLIQTV